MKSIRRRISSISSKQSTRDINHKLVCTKSPGLYFSRDGMPSFLGKIVCFLVPVDIFLDRANKHDVHSVTGNFEVDFKLGIITGGKTT